MNISFEQMDPCPLPEDLNPGPARIHGHGITGSMHGARRGIFVSVKMLKKRGVSIGKKERAGQSAIVGELLISRVHDRLRDHQAIAEVVRFENYHFPSRQAVLLDPIVYSADERGMVIQGIEKVQVDGVPASFQQVWLVLFGNAPPEPPP